MSAFGNIANYVYKTLSNTLIKRQQFNLPNFIKNDSVNTILNDLERIVTHKIHGVIIYWSPHGTGKTTNLKHFVTQMNIKEDTDVITHYLNAHEGDFEKKLNYL